MKHRFFDDYSEGVHPELLRYVADHNDGQEDGYGEDQASELAIERITGLLDGNVSSIHFVTGSTQAEFGRHRLTAPQLRGHHCPDLRAYRSARGRCDRGDGPQDPHRGHPGWEAHTRPRSARDEHPPRRAHRPASGGVRDASDRGGYGLPLRRACRRRPVCEGPPPACLRRRCSSGDGSWFGRERHDLGRSPA